MNIENRKTINKTMKKKIGLILFIIGLLHPSLHAQKTEKLMLSGDGGEDTVLWDFYCTAGRNSGQWTKIKVPSCWELEGFGEYNYGHDEEKANEEGRYRTSFDIPESWKDKRIFVVFEGSMTDTEVKVNGQQAGDVHQGAFYQFKREITGLVDYDGANNLEVNVRKMSSNPSINSAERTADFWVFGGIFRPVYLEAMPEVHMEYVGIDAKANGDIRIEAFLDQEVGEGELYTEIIDLTSGKSVGNFTVGIAGKTKHIRAVASLSEVNPWTPESPSLYQAVVSVKRKDEVLHSVTERFGFRTIDVRERDGVYINDKKIKFKGVNRHSFWPSSGRTMSRAQNLQDILLIKEMNMNAVRMSHYPPDKDFLELCDSVGLYVINELCAWQKPAYDTEVGSILVQEMVKRDMNHPSIIFWANGNEGGFNTDFDPMFPQLDVQKRPVIHPFALFGKINTTHYITYNSGIKSMFNGRDIFMPTELLHGLYDGGHGAGLDDYWNLMLSNPLSAGMFLWDFADQGVLRTDKDNILDTDKDHGADGIVGPYREKEGSFFTIKEIWSPIYIAKKYITSSWNGELPIENRYDFTNTDQCSFSYTFARFDGIDGAKNTTEGTVDAPDIQPGEKGVLALTLPEDWRTYDVLYLTARDMQGAELFTWSYELNSPAYFSERILKKHAARNTGVELTDTDSVYTLSAASVAVQIHKKTGLLAGVISNGKMIPLSDGPMYITEENLSCDGVELIEEEQTYKIQVVYRFKNGGKAYQFTWKMNGDGILELDYDYRPQERMEMAGVTFNFPEEGVEGAQLLANGPYRVYNNRMKGGKLDIWDKAYNDAITGETWEYPEFKGYYSLFYGMRLRCPTPFEIYSASEDLILHLFTPAIQRNYDPKRNFTFPKYPNGNISFMDAIPAVGSKFGIAADHGPQSQHHTFKTFSGTPNMTNRIFFKFN